MKALRYGLWAATLVVTSWALALISAVVAGKGGIVRVAGTDQVPLERGLYSGAGELP